MANGNSEVASFWKPLALSLMTALVTFMLTTWTMWPRDVATGTDIMILRDEISSGRIELQKLAVQFASLSERVRIQQFERNLEVK